MNRLLWIALSAALLLAGCTTSYIVELQPLPDQRDSFLAGVRIVDSQKLVSVVRVAPLINPVEKRGSLVVLAFNGGEAPFNFGTENITARLRDGSPVHVISYGELAEEERDRQRREAIGLALSAIGGSLQASSAGYSTSTTNFSGNAYGAGGSSTVYGTGVTTTYDPAAAQAAQALANQQTRANVDAVQANREVRGVGLNRILRTTTVNPGLVFGGEVQFDLPEADDAFELVVSVGGDVHTFVVSFTPTE